MEMINNGMSNKVRVGITRDLFDKDGKPLTPGPSLKLLDDMPKVEHGMFPEFLHEVTAEQIKGFNSVITLRPKWTRQTVSGNKQLISVHRCGVGYDNIDVSALSDAGILLCTSPKTTRRPMAIAILTLLLALSARLIEKYNLIRQGRWTKAMWGEGTKYYGYSLEGKTLGSIGVGNISRELFNLTKPFGMNYIAYDPYVSKESIEHLGIKLVDLNTLLAESDFLNVGCQLTEETHHLISEKEFRRMKKTAFLINMARGPIVDEKAMIKALQEGWIKGAGLDVFEQEPTSPDNPLLKLDNVIVTPHNLVWTNEQWMNRWDEILSQISQVIRGDIPDGLINREVWDTAEFQAKLKTFLESIK